MKATTYTTEFKEEALKKVLSRGHQTIEMLAEQLNMSHHTLKKWITQMNKRSRCDAVSSAKCPADWTMQERLIALNQSYALEGEELASWCRQQGLFEHHLQQWRDEFCGMEARNSKQQASEVRDLKQQVHRLERHLDRKEKALAEAAALIVLHRNFQSLLGGEAE